MSQSRKPGAAPWENASGDDQPGFGLLDFSKIGAPDPLGPSSLLPILLPAPASAQPAAPAAAAAPVIFEVDLTSPIDASDLSALKSKVSGSTSGGTTTTTTTVLTSYVTGQNNGIADTAEYNIQIVFKGSLWTATLQDAFKAAADAIATYIVGDVPAVTVVGSGGKYAVDDIRITAEIANIDGLNGILGQAGPTALRTGSYLPAAASMTFDQADASALVSSGYWGAVVLHEMMHSVGFGSIWTNKNLVQKVDAATAWYTGANGNAAYRAQFGLTDPNAKIAVETDGGSGTAYSHWDETTYGTELMTGYLNTGTGVTDPLTQMSIASLEDLGYKVAAAYDYTPIA